MAVCKLIAYLNPLLFFLYLWNMFESIIRVCKNVKKLDEGKLFKRVFDNKGVQRQVIDLNQSQMYDDGIDSKGQELGQYHPYTIVIKEKKGQRTDHITLKDTGEFYGSMKIKAGKDGIVISADMKKPDTDLEKIYPFALGLNEKSLSEIREFILPIYIEEVRMAILA